MLANNGNYKAGYGFFLLLQTLWALIQDMVGFQTPTHNVIDLTIDGTGSFTPKMNWIADILTTIYYLVVLIVMLNLLIGEQLYILFKYLYSVITSYIYIHVYYSINEQDI